MGDISKMGVVKLGAADVGWGERLKSIRRRLGYTTTKVAEMTSISQSHISSFENEKAVPNLHMLGRILDCYGVTFESFFAGEGMPPDIIDIMLLAGNLTKDQRAALRSFLQTLETPVPAEEADSHVESVAAHLERQYGIHDAALAEHITGKIEEAQTRFDAARGKGNEKNQG